MVSINKAPSPGTYAGYAVKAERQAMSCIHRIRKVIGGVSKKLEEHLGQNKLIKESHALQRKQDNHKV